MTAFLVILFAYLLGSVPTGFLLGSLAGVDVRKTGSGNVGATNVGRVAGKKHGILTLLGDTAKGFVPVFVALQMGLGAAATGLVALAAFLGHLYPVFLKFQGGKGVATALGIVLFLSPVTAFILVVLFDSKENYVANANSPEQDKEYRKLRDLLAADPHWHDGEVIHQFWVK